MTDRELEDFIKFGEENIIEASYMVGGGWAKHAITIAKALRERLSQPEREWVGLTEDEKQFFKAMGFSGIDIVEAKLKEKNT